MSWLSKINTPILAVPDRRAGYRNRPRSWLYLIAVLLTFSGAPLAHAGGPTLPIRFEELSGQDGQWAVGVVTDTAQIGPVRVERSVYANGERLSVEPIEARSVSAGAGARTESRMQLPLNFKGMNALAKTGAFAQKIVVEGHWLAQPSGPALQVQRWFYFKVVNGEARPVSLEEYSALTDPPEAAVDSSGKPGLVYRGTDVKADRPLPQTKGSPDQPVIMQEPGKRAAPQPKTDFSERNER